MQDVDTVLLSILGHCVGTALDASPKLLQILFSVLGEKTGGHLCYPWRQQNLSEGGTVQFQPRLAGSEAAMAFKDKGAAD
jgi:hypothetical protein